MPISTTVATPTVPSSAASSTPTVTSPSTAVTSPSTTQPSVMAVSRPYLDPSICTATGAWEADLEDYTIDALFWIRTADPFSMQVVGDPALGTSGAFAMVLRFPVHLAEVGAGRELRTIGSWTVGLIASSSGTGDALWDLPDGGQGYLRFRDLTIDQVDAVIASLEPRTPGAAIAGFDVAATADLPLLAEHMNSGIDARGAGFTCQTDDEHPFQYRVDAWDGEPVYEFLVILDRARPLDAGNVNGTTIVIGSGVPTDRSPRVTQVTNADPAIWDALVQSSNP